MIGTDGLHGLVHNANLTVIRAPPPEYYYNIIIVTLQQS